MVDKYDEVFEFVGKTSKILVNSEFPKIRYDDLEALYFYLRDVIKWNCNGYFEDSDYRDKFVVEFIKKAANKEGEKFKEACSFIIARMYEKFLKGGKTASAACESIKLEALRIKRKEMLDPKFVDFWDNQTRRKLQELTFNINGREETKFMIEILRHKWSKKVEMKRKILEGKIKKFELNSDLIDNINILKINWLADILQRTRNNLAICRRERTNGMIKRIKDKAENNYFQTEQNIKKRMNTFIREENRMVRQTLWRAIIIDKMNQMKADTERQDFKMHCLEIKEHLIRVTLKFEIVEFDLVDIMVDDFYDEACVEPYRELLGKELIEVPIQKKYTNDEEDETLTREYCQSLGIKLDEWAFNKEKLEQQEVEHLDFDSIPEINKRIRKQKIEIEKDNWADYIENDWGPIWMENEVEYDLKFSDWEKTIPLKDALMEKIYYDEYFCKGVFQYYWTLDMLREILGKNIHTENQEQFDLNARITQLKIKNEILIKELDVLKSKNECRIQYSKILKAKYEAGTIKREKENLLDYIKNLNLEDLMDKKIYVKKLTEAKNNGKILEELEEKRFINLQKEMPKKCFDIDRMEPIEINKMENIMNKIREAWEDVGGQGMKYLGREKCKELIMDCVFLTVCEKFMCNDNKGNGEARRSLIKYLKQSLRYWFCWRRGFLATESLWKFCVVFERKMEDAGIKGQMITGQFKSEIFKKMCGTSTKLRNGFGKKKIKEGSG
jgi:hypothetical protein